MRKVLILVLPLFFVACNSETWSGDGIILEKIYDDEDVWWVPGYTIRGSETCSGGYNGQLRVCTRTPDINIPGYWQTDPEHFYFKIQDLVHEKEDEPPIFRIEVNEELYTRCEVSQRYTRSENWCGKHNVRHSD